jgi:hypothetical protein
MGTPDVPDAPTPPPPPASVLDPALSEARRKAMRKARGRAGFNATILAGARARPMGGRAPSLIGVSSMGGGSPVLGA